MPDEGFASIVQMPQRDLGTNTVSHRTEPETFESPADNSSTGAVKPEGEVTYESLEHLDGPTGAAQQITEPVTVHADWPRPDDTPQPSEHQAAPQQLEEQPSKPKPAPAKARSTTKKRGS